MKSPTLYYIGRLAQLIVEVALWRVVEVALWGVMV